MKLKENIETIFLSFLETLSVSLIFYLAADYFLVQKSGILFALPQNGITFAFFTFLSFFLFLNLFVFQSLKRWPATLIAVVIIFILSAFFFKKYQIWLESQKDTPKIYKVQGQEGIQAELITIKGRNLGFNWQPGKVFVNDVEFIVKKWSPTEIIAEQPVPPKFFEGNLYVIAGNGKKSNTLKYKFKDPKYLLEKTNEKNN